MKYFNSSFIPLKFIPLNNIKACIRRREEKCILRYYLNFNNDEDLARGLLILFHPFTNEMEEIHEQDVTELYNKHRENIEAKRHLFEKHKILTEIINSIEKENLLEMKCGKTRGKGAFTF